MMWLIAALLAAAAPQGNAHVIVDRAIAAMQRQASLERVSAVRLAGIEQEFVLGNAERAEGPWRARYTEFAELRDPRSGAMRRTEATLSATGAKSVEWTTIVSDTVVAIVYKNRESGSSHGAYEDVVDRIDGSPARALMLASASRELRDDGTVRRFGLTFDVVSFPWRNGRMKIEVNHATRLPEAVEIVRAYPDNFRWNIFGVVAMRADYVDWNLLPSGVYWPMQVKVSLNHQPLRDVTFATAALDTIPAPADSFAISDSARVQFSRNSRFNFSRLRLGDRGAPSELRPDIVRVPDQWAMTLVKQPDGVVVFEAHISGQYLHDVVAEANRHWPGSPIKAIVLTSDPWAHLGGFRAAVDMNVPIYVSRASMPFLRTLVPTKSPRFVPVSGKTVIGAGRNAIALYPVGGPYAERMLMAHFPALRLLYGADLVFNNPASDGSPGKTFDATPLVDLRAAVAREHLVVDTVFSVQNSGPVAWDAFVAAVPGSGHE